jgi:transposase
MIQPVLSCCESIDTDLSVFLDDEESEFYVYLGVALLERVSVSPEKIDHKMLIGRLYNGGAKLSLLRERFGHDPRTVKKWGNALKSCDINEIANAFAGRKACLKSTPELIRYVCQQYRIRSFLGRSFREKIIMGVDEIFGVKISPSLVSKICHSEKISPKLVNEESTEIVKNMATVDLAEQKSSSNNSSTVQRSPCFLSKFHDMTYPGKRMLQHAGLILFDSATVNYDPLEQQIICQLLQGAVNIEQSKTLCFESLRFFNNELIQCLREQRTQLDHFATPENVIELYRKNNQLLNDGPGRGMIFYFDPHTKHYTGQLKILKSWCGSLHSVSKVINLDCFHTLSGRPCFIQHYSPYYDMRERFFISISQFDKLFPPEQRSGRTFIIDRGIFGQACFDKFENDYLITWEKNFDGSSLDDDKPIIKFTKKRTKNRENDKRKKKYIFECQEAPWSKNSKFRRIIVKATYREKTIIVSVLCSNPEMNIQDIVWLIFNRWLQENDFKYLDVHFGINQLDSRSSFDFKEISHNYNDRKTETAEYKQIKKQTQQINNALAKNLLKINRKTSSIEKKKLKQEQLQLAIKNNSTGAKGFLKELKKINKSITAMQKYLKKLNSAREIYERDLEIAEYNQTQAIKKDSRIQQLLQENYRLLDTRRKSYMDALRINAANIFRNLHADYREIYNNYRDDHHYLRVLTRCSGSVEYDKTGLIISLWLPGSMQKHIIQPLDKLVQLVSAKFNENLESDKITIKLVTGVIRP